MNLQSIKEKALLIHKDENGDIPVGQIMVIGLIAVPLVIGLVAFRDDIVNWLSGQIDKFKAGEGETNYSSGG